MTSYTYDLWLTGTGQPLAVFQPNGESVLRTYDSAGNRLRMVDAQGNATAWTYDQLGRVLSETITLDQFDAQGQDIGDRPVSRTWVYDGLTTVYTDRNGYISTIMLDPAARTQSTTVTDLDGYNYHSTISLHSDGSTDTMSDSLVAADYNGSGSAVSYEYDDLGRVRNTTSDFLFGDLTGPASYLGYTYFATGPRQQTELWLDGTLITRTEYAIDALGRLTGLGQRAFQGPTWWVDGNVAPDKSVAFTYNADGQRKSISRFTTLAADGVHPVSAADDAVHGFTNYLYHADGRLKDLSHHRYREADERYSDQATIAGYATEYDPAGRLVYQKSMLVELDDEGVPVTAAKVSHVHYDYDESGQLLATGVGSASRDQAAWSPVGPYDNGGNRLGTQTGRANRLREDQKYRYRYDDEGRLLEQVEKDGPLRVAFQWDHRGLLLRADVHFGDDLFSTVQFAYDVTGRQVASVHSYDDAADPTGQTQIVTRTGRVWDGQTRLLDLIWSDGETQPRIDWSYFVTPGSGEVLAVDMATGTSYGTQTLWAFADLQGSPATWGWYNEQTGNWQHQHNPFAAFGAPQARLGVIEIAGTTLDLTTYWAGHRLDPATGLYDEVRWYDPQSSHFLSEDPLDVFYNTKPDRRTHNPPNDSRLVGEA